MPAALSIRQRRDIIEKQEQGWGFTRIARELEVSYSSVYRICHRYEKTGELTPAYERCRQTEVRKPHAIYEKAVQLKGDHPSWGAGLIWVELADEFGEEELPSHRTLQRWFKRAGVANPKRDKRPLPDLKRGQGAHEVWALDAKEQIPLADGSAASWLTITDEGSGAILEAHVFPPQAVEPGRPVTGESRSANHNGDMGASGKDTHG